MTIEDRFAVAQLLDEYGRLLTDKQRETVAMYCDMDLSLQEVAQEFGTTRQAVRDIIVRAVAALEQYEQALGNVRRKTQALHLLNGATTSNWQQTVAAVVKLLEE